MHTHTHTHQIQKPLQLHGRGTSCRDENGQNLRPPNSAKQKSYMCPSVTFPRNNTCPHTKGDGITKSNRRRSHLRSLFLTFRRVLALNMVQPMLCATHASITCTGHRQSMIISPGSNTKHGPTNASCCTRLFHTCGASPIYDYHHHSAKLRTMGTPSPQRHLHVHRLENNHATSRYEQNLAASTSEDVLHLQKYSKDDLFAE